MADELISVGGSKIYIGGTATSKAADFAEGDFTSDWTEIDGWESMGGFGDAAELITTNLINRGRALKQKGTRDAQNMENSFALLRSDPGQQALIEASNSNSNYEFKVEFDNAPEGGSSGTSILFIGLVNDVSISSGGANSTLMRSGTIAINSNLVIVPAA